MPWLKKWSGKARNEVEWSVFEGNAHSVLMDLPSEAFNCVITSPPYYWLRDYEVEQQIGQDIRRSLLSYRGEWIALFVGLELGAMSHSLSDWINSAYKRSKRKPRRTSTSRKRTSSRRTSKK